MRRLGRSPGGVLAAALLAANCGNLLFHLVAVRGIGPVGYGELGALLGVLTALTVPISALQTVVAGKVARAREGGEALDPWPAVRTTAWCAVAATVLCAALSPLLGAYVRTGSAWPGLLLALYLLPATVCVVPWGFLYGTGRGRHIALAVVTGASCRVVLGGWLSAAGQGVTGAMAATLIADCVQVTILLAATASATRVPVRTRAPATEASVSPRTPATLASDPLRTPATRATLPTRTPLRLTAPEALRSSAAVAGMWALLGIDVLTARHFLAVAEAGRYATAALAAKSVLFLAQIAATVLIRRFASRSGVTARAALTAGLAAATAVGLAATAALVLFGGPILRAAAGGGDVVGPYTRGMLGLAITACALLGIVVQALLARGPHRAWPTWLGPAVFAALTAVLHPTSAFGVSAALAAAATTALAACLLDARRNTSPPAQPASPRDAIPKARTSTQTAVRAQRTVELSIVIPYFNPGAAIAATVRQTAEALEALDSRHLAFEVIAVSDGSNDGSPALLADALPPHLADRLIALELPYNQGKGAALRTGFEHAHGRYVGFIDADGDLDPALLAGMYETARGFDLDAVVGAKRHTCSIAAAAHDPLRGLTSRVFARLAATLFRLPVTDTQTGIKIFRADALDAALPHSRENRFVIDLELLALMHRQGARRVMEVPVRFRPRVGSTVTTAAIALMIRDVLAFRVRLFGIPKPRRTQAAPAPAHIPRAFTHLAPDLALHAGAR
ncbi:glycosyltransferase [Yinghuangia soli]|uniref:Glycosyltransferase n=1 Tax=Yinghuangia soli TaxID=2908204 RepID=A0AA41U3N6_9ACTN|nr:glycosyltransferase [Yinghuangia soli]MCF2528239.1 glycosyltransferase [Yinghuangia soli]